KIGIDCPSIGVAGRARRYPPRQSGSGRNHMRVVLSRVGTAAVLLGLGLAGVFTASPARADGPGPWARTETRTPCASFNLLRHPYFGETHVHTVYSVDASIFDVRNTPRDAYRFATGEEIGLTPYDAEGHPRRTLRLRRPLGRLHVHELRRLRVERDPARKQPPSERDLPER